MYNIILFKMDIRTTKDNKDIQTMKEKKPYEYKFTPEITSIDDLDKMSFTVKDVVFKERIDINNTNDVLSPDLKDDDIVIAKQCGNYFKYGRVAYKNYDKIFKNNNHNLFEVCTGMRGKFSKYLFDIDNKQEIAEDNIEGIEKLKVEHEATIKMFLNDVIEFFNRFANINIKLEDIKISSANGYENGKVIFSNHIILPIIIRWANIQKLSRILHDGFINKYTSLRGAKYIDGSVYTVKGQNYRMLRQSKFNSNRVKTPENVNDTILDNLVLIYNDDDLLKYPNIDKSIDEFILDIKNPSKKLLFRDKNEKNIILTNSLINITQNIDDLDLDKFTYSLKNIPNNINLITWKEWTDIVFSAYGYSQTIIENPKLQIKNNPYHYSLNPKKIEEIVINALADWTNSGYIKTPPDYSKHSNDILKKILKSKSQTDYSNKKKPELIEMLKRLDTFDYSLPNIGDIESHRENIKNIFNSLKNNPDCNKLFYNKHKRDLAKIERIAREYNKDATKNWIIKQNIPVLTILNKQKFFDNFEYPHYKTKTFYQQTMGYKYIYLEAIMGKGKTDIIINYLMECTKLNILVVCPRLTLSNASKSRYNKDFEVFNEKMDFTIYTDSKKDTDLFNNPEKLKRLICSPESIYKINKEKIVYDVIVLDEFDTLGYSINSSTCKQMGLYDLRINSLFHHINNAKKVIIAEAIPSIATVSLMKDLVEFDTNKKIKLEVSLTEKIKYFPAYNALKHLVHYTKTDFTVYIENDNLKLLDNTDIYKVKNVKNKLYRLELNPNTLQAIPIMNTLNNIGSKNNNIYSCITSDIRFKQKYILKASYTSCFSQPIEDKFVKDLVEHLKTGVNINAFISNAKLLRRIKDELDKINIKCVIIHADNKNEMNKYLINRGELLKTEEIQFFGYTSTCGIGFSQESTNYWTCKYIYYSNFGNITDTCISSSMALQSNYRCRYTLDNDVEQTTYIYIMNQPNTVNKLSISNTTNVIDNLKNCLITKKNIKLFNHLLTKQNDGYNNIVNAEDDNDIIEDDENIVNSDKDLENIKVLNEFIIINEKYNNNLITRTLTEDFKYQYIDGNNTYTISKKLVEQYYNAGLVFNKELTQITTNLKNAIELQNNFDNKYFEDIIKAKVLKQTNIWDDNNVIRTFAKDKNDTCKNEKDNVNNTCEKQDVKQDVKQENEESYWEDDDLFDNEYKRNTTIYSAYWLGIDIVEIDIKRFNLYNFNRLLDKDYNKYQTDTNIHGDPLNDIDDRRRLTNVYTYFNYLNYGNKPHLPILNENTKLISTLITHFHKYNHLNLNRVNVETKSNTINWLFEKFINIDQFKANFIKCEISSLVIDANKKEIEMKYYDYINVFKLKSRRDDVKTVSKLSFLFNEIFGIDINTNVENKLVYINKVRTRTCNFHLDIIAKVKLTKSKTEEANDNIQTDKQIEAQNKKDNKQHEKDVDIVLQKLMFITILNEFSYISKSNNKKPIDIVDTQKIAFINDDSDTYTDNENNDTDNENNDTDNENTDTDDEEPIEVIKEPIEVIEEPIKVMEEPIEIVLPILSKNERQKILSKIFNIGSIKNYTNEPDDYKEFLVLKQKNIRLMEVEDIKRYRVLAKSYLNYKPILPIVNIPKQININNKPLPIKILKKQVKRIIIPPIKKTPEYKQELYNKQKEIYDKHQQILLENIKLYLWKK